MQALALFAAVLAVTPLAALEVTVHVSSLTGDRIAKKAPLQLQPAPSTQAAAFRIDDAATHQRIAGFGATFLEAGMICLRALDKPQQESLLAALRSRQGRRLHRHEDAHRRH